MLELINSKKGEINGIRKKGNMQETSIKVEELYLIISAVTTCKYNIHIALKRTALVRLYKKARYICVCCLKGRNFKCEDTDGLKVTEWANMQNTKHNKTDKTVLVSDKGDFQDKTCCQGQIEIFYNDKGSVYQK